MRKMKRNILIAAIVFGCGIVASCTGKRAEVRPVMCTIEEALAESPASQAVWDVMVSLEVDDRYEQMYSEEEAGLTVWSLLRCSEEASSEGMGVMVIKDGKATAFPDIRHGNQPSARYDAASQTLWLACGDMEGTGVYVERLYQLRFAEDGTASIVQSTDPYDMQQALHQRLGYSIDGQNVSFYDNGKLLCSVTDTVSDMGGFDEDPIWIGEQLRYDVSGDAIRVLCLPGLKYVTGLVLNYDAMPTIAATLTFSPDGSFSLGNVGIEK